ncbi:membrane glycosyltransferase [Aestuariivirga litoralis]|uniref:Membrane glycosyltransferase n=1 Tax=Aestuariivirga litoralis TaxID=2650924 RepID=A0A2W2BDT3_9HYPH|nr:glycosyltransferase [Aestuariivirga litoralis]PZF78368.1 membrane glycosyltransferase [Aestuariivirga litoralis]
MSSDSERIAIVIPLFNDWDCLGRLLADIGGLPVEGRTFSIFVVDDCSMVPAPEIMGHLPPSVEQLECIRLRSNVGHQRSAAIGLSIVAERTGYDAVIVMDADGEDRPSDIPNLLAAHAANPLSLIVAQRQKRSEPAGFKVMYQLFKALFRILTGRTIDFGNFCLIPFCHLDRLIFMRELWSHLGATLLKSRLPLVRVPTARGTRYKGKSSMSLPSLIIHGFSAIAVFMDAVFVRLIMLCIALMTLAAAGGIAAATIRVLTSIAIPGWATNVVGVSAIIAFQALTLLTIAAIMMLASNSSVPSVPGRDGRLLVGSCRLLASHRPSSA